ncbi:YeeE/YedE family protein [Deltaproteobacteria bacterium OttesenSCG-928-K17]|nr:YeeE/YedE family protein [Deltaproteobacteria bacterium OttesenSCG-928-K17]
MMATAVKKLSTSRERAPRKPKTSQIPYAILLTIAVIVFGFYVARDNVKLPLFWMFGICFGFVLQRARFCFTASMRDPSLTGSTSLTRAVLAAIALTTIGFAALKYGAVIGGTGKNLNMVSVVPIGPPLIIGALLFGVGMVIAGGCASGTLMRVGEGFTMQILALFFFIVGSVWGAHDMGTIWGAMNASAPKIFLPDVFGWFGALIVQGLIITLLYIAAVKWQKKKMAGNI